MTIPTRAQTASQFSRQAEAYATSPSHAADADLEILAEFAAAGPSERCLDIATGPGHTAFRIARDGGLVIGADIATGMIAAARHLAEERSCRNVAFILADVHALPFPDASLDLATCRIAAHHFADLGTALREVSRVLRPGGRFALEDSLGPEAPEVAHFLEQLEKDRDSTHVHSLSRSEWLAALDSAGLQVVRETVFAKRHAFDLWIRRTGLDESQIATIVDRILNAPADVRSALFEVENGQVSTLHDRKLILRAEKP